MEEVGSSPVKGPKVEKISMIKGVSEAGNAATAVKTSCHRKAKRLRLNIGQILNKKK